MSNPIGKGIATCTAPRSEFRSSTRGKDTALAAGSSHGCFTNGHARSRGGMQRYRHLLASDGLIEIN